MLAYTEASVALFCFYASTLENITQFVFPMLQIASIINSPTPTMRAHANTSHVDALSPVCVLSDHRACVVTYTRPFYCTLLNTIYTIASTTHRMQPCIISMHPDKFLHSLHISCPRSITTATRKTCSRSTRITVTDQDTINTRDSKTIVIDVLMQIISSHCSDAPGMPLEVPPSVTRQLSIVVVLVPRISMTWKYHHVQTEAIRVFLSIISTTIPSHLPYWGLGT